MAISYDDAAHLLRRAGFGPTASEINALVGLDRSAAVERILDVSSAPPVVTPGGIGDPSLNNFEKWVNCTHWWIDRMRTTTAPLAEKMTFFWHNHFATSLEKVEFMDLLWEQQQILRAGALGNFRDLTMTMSLHPALLWYLDNTTNTAAAPNENFARELMELFILGVGRYSQADVVAAARAWTGHGMVSYQDQRYRFDATDHDSGSKTFMGGTRNWDGPDIINELLRDNLATKATAAAFIARKLWSWFAFPSPSDAVIAPVADAFLASDFNITAMLRAMFNHDAFYSPEAHMALVRTPVEYIVAALRSLGMDAATSHPVWFLEGMGMQPFMPPNVAGWKQNMNWVTSSAFWAKANFIQFSAWKASTGSSLALADLDTRDTQSATQAAFDTFGISSPSASSRTTVVNWLTKQRATQYEGWVDRRYLISLVALSPDFQLA